MSYGGRLYLSVQMQVTNNSHKNVHLSASRCFRAVTYAGFNRGGGGKKEGDPNRAIVATEKNFDIICRIDFE